MNIDKKHIYLSFQFILESNLEGCYNDKPLVETNYRKNGAFL